MTDNEPATPEDAGGDQVWAHAKDSGQNFIATGNGTIILDPDRIPLPSYHFGPTELHDVERYYVEPAIHQEAKHRLLRDRLLVLHGDTGFGKLTTALQLLLDAQQSVKEQPEAKPLELRKIRTDWSGEPKYERLPYDANHGFLLDLSDWQQPLAKGFVDGLNSYRWKLKKATAYAVVVVPTAVLHGPDRSTTEYALRLEAPASARSIARRRVQETFPERGAWMEDAAILELLPDGARPRDAVRLANAISHASEKTETEEAIRRAVDEFRGWRNYLLQWFAEHPEPFDRAALFALALTNGTAAAHEVSRLALNLVELVEGADLKDHNPLRAPDLSSRLDKIDTVEEAGRIKLSPDRPGLDDAVLDHMWHERPALRDDFQLWVLQLTSNDDLKRPVVKRIATALTEMSIRSGTAAFLDAISKWDSDDEHDLRLAHEMLERTVLDPSVGSAVRTRVSGWAQRKTYTRLTEVVADLCAGEFGRKMPGAAMTRLRYLLRNSDERVRTAGGRAVLELGSHPKSRDVVLATALDWMDKPKHREVGARAFLALVQSDRWSRYVREAASEDLQMRRVLSTGWARLYESGQSRAAAVEAMSTWLLTADREGSDLDVAMEALDSVLATAMSGSIHHELYSAVAKGSDGDVRLSERVFERILAYFHDEPVQQSPAPAPAEGDIDAAL